jgi:ribosomal protein L11 methyltransferase
MLELFPEGFEEVDAADGVELVAYTTAGGEERIRAVFEGATAADFADDWADRWRRFHRSVTVGNVWVGPPWEKPPPGAIPVVIEPGRAFGTGGHPTSRLCLELLLEQQRGDLVDCGCGSGVLAIAAAKLGFAPVVALDHDPDAVEATSRNATANAVELDVRLADILRDELPTADVAVANISSATVAALGPRLRTARVIASGYVERDEPELAGYRPVARRTSAGWAADLYERQ